jgi:hypothetical protein
LTARTGLPTLANVPIPNTFIGLFITKVEVQQILRISVFATSKFLQAERELSALSRR